MGPFSASRAPRVLVGVGVALWLCLVPNPGRAETSEDGQASQRALTLGHEALEAFERGDHPAALERFERAEAAAHSPVFVLYIARSHAALGRLLRARESFEALVGEELPENAPEAWLGAQQSARQELEALASEIPSISLVIEGAARGPFEMSVGDEHVRFDDRTRQLELDPGSYECVVTDADGQRRKHEFNLERGERDKPVVVEFPKKKPAPAPKLPAQSKAKSKALTPLPPAEPEASNLDAWAALGVGVAATTLGLVAGSVAWFKARDVRSQCSGGRCPTRVKDDAKEARTWANVSSIGFAVGMAGIGGGLLLWDDGSPPRAGASQSGPTLFVTGTF